MSHQPSFVSIVWVVFWLGFFFGFCFFWANNLHFEPPQHGGYTLTFTTLSFIVLINITFPFRSALQLTSRNAQVITHRYFFKWESELYRTQATTTKKKQHYYLWFCPLLPRKPQPSPCYAQPVSISKKCNFNMLRILGTPTICRHVWASDYKGSLYAKLKRTE